MSSFDGPVTIRHVRFCNEQSGWAVLEAAAAHGQPVALVGPLVHLEAGERAHVLGEWVSDARYGRQVRVAEARPLAPEDPDALIAYLRRVRHVGVRRAADLVQRFGSGAVLDAIDRDPTAAFAEVGLGQGRALEAARSWQELRVTRQLHLLLAPHGLAYLTGRIHEHYGADAHQLIVRDPYALTSVFGVGFQIADRIARAGDVGADRRPGAAIMHALAESERDGSTCMPVGDLLAAAEALLGEPPDEPALGRLIESGQAVREGEWVYRAATAELEAELAERVAELVSSAPAERLRGRSAAAPPDGAALTEEQTAALRAAFARRLSVITGGPGTGKTASIRAIAAHAERRGARVLLVAPTGRAAVRMSECSAVRAKTVHSALGWIPGEGPTHDEQDPLAADLLIVDETSMANLELLVTLLRAVAQHTHVVLVGDADQLAPVGAGKPFAELVASERVPTARLTHIFRQAAGSMIVQGAHAIRRGAAPEFRPAPEMRRDLFMIERSSARDGLAEIVSLVAERLPEHYDIDPVRDIQVFAPVYRGELGIDVINRALRERLNPDGRPVRGGRLRIGDKLMMTGRNLHEKGLMNGTVLRLLDEVDDGRGGRDDEDDGPGDGRGGRGDEDDGPRDDPALILAADDATFRLAHEDADQLRLAYACSVHRGQGIELPVAVIVAHPAAGAFFLRREMLYTALTRATLATVVVGTRQVVARAARTADTGRRHGRLGERLTALASDRPRAGLAQPVGGRPG
ncbi:MAG: AAA family ATPase [Solirubrobacterales bacterium]|nr:AAA family ATPase [Solirubrobacterales bacterium]